jgi:Fe2+ transport system protein FeoA
LEENPVLHLQFLRNTQTNNSPRNPHLAARRPTLAQAGSGQAVTIAGFENLSPVYCQHLQAYGLLPGRSVVVLAQQPVTIVLVEQTELAFENEIARQVLVE